MGTRRRTLAVWTKVVLVQLFRRKLPSTVVDIEIPPDRGVMWPDDSLPGLRLCGNHRRAIDGIGNRRIRTVPAFLKRGGPGLTVSYISHYSIECAWRISRRVSGFWRCANTNSRGRRHTRAFFFLHFFDFLTGYVFSFLAVFGHSD